MKFPNFIIIGAARCGTTVLWFNLDKHPDITMAVKNEARGKTEMYFWGTDKCNPSGIELYKKMFNGKVSGEKTPSYHGNKSASLQMKKYIPDVKLIMCVRNPVDRAYSNWRMNMRSGKAPQTFTYDLFKRRYAKGGLYIKTLKANVLSVFEKDQLYICVTEWMKRNTVEEMNKIYEFLNLPNAEIERKVVDPPLPNNAPENMKMFRQQPWYRVFDNYQNSITGPIRKQMLQYYKEPNKQLFDFLGYEIEEWSV